MTTKLIFVDDQLGLFSQTCPSKKSIERSLFLKLLTSEKKVIPFFCFAEKDTLTYINLQMADHVQNCPITQGSKLTFLFGSHVATNKKNFGCQIVNFGCQLILCITCTKT